MRRLQIMIDEDLDDALTVRARRDGTSKASLLRAAARAHYLDRAPDPDPLLGMVGVDRGTPLSPEESIDSVVYR